jgi:peptidoglycan-associated lipoprotein
MRKFSVVVAFMAVALLIAGCGGRSAALPDDDNGMDRVAGAGGGASGASTAGVGGGGGFGEFADGPSARLLDNLVVYFEFDRSEIRSDFNDILVAHGQYLANNPRAGLRLEGHTDERGSREYNIGLGERRAQAVRSFLLLQGASADQITTVSYGEERPAAFGSNDEAWALNRRVELVYRQ